MDLKQLVAVALASTVACSTLDAVRMLVQENDEPHLRTRLQDPNLYATLSNELESCRGRTSGYECDRAVIEEARAIRQAISILHARNLAAAPACVVGFHDEELVPESQKFEAIASGNLVADAWSAECKRSICNWRKTMYASISCDGLMVGNKR